MNEKQMHKPKSKGKVASSPLSPEKADSVVKTSLLLPDGHIYEIELSFATTAEQFIESVAKHFRLDENRWQLMMKTDETMTYFKGDEMLGEFLSKSEKATLYFYPEIAAG